VYDDNGNLTSDGLRGLGYDAENQLVQVTVTNNWRSKFTYDGFGRRRVRTEYVWQNNAWVVQAVVRYVYDGLLVMQERDGNNVPVVTYTRGRDLSGSRQRAGGIGGLLARTDNAILTGGASGAHAYYHADGNGNVTLLATDKATVVARYLYDPFGNLLAKAGPLVDANLYRFSSKEVHPPSGLCYYGFRFYEPNLQRWLNGDPISERGGLNQYRFVRNSPIEAFDLLGLCGLYARYTGLDPSVEPFSLIDQLARSRSRVLCEWLRRHHPELNVNCDRMKVVPSPLTFWYDGAAYWGTAHIALSHAAFADPDELVGTIAHEFMHLAWQESLGERIWDHWLWAGVGHAEIYTAEAEIVWEFRKEWARYQ
jgi:RHS repeat-associated protein